MARPVILVSGKDPYNEEGGNGHTVYVRSHARAAIRAGYEPHIFAVGPVTGREVSDIGFIYRCATPLRPYRQLGIPLHSAPLARGIATLVPALASAEPIVVHGFGVWSHAGVRAARRLNRNGSRVRPIASSYTTHEDENRSMLESLMPDTGLAVRMRYAAEYAWAKTVVSRFERLGYAGSRFVMVNYAAVGRLIRRAHGDAVTLRMSRYAAESAFLSDLSSGSRPPREPGVLATVSVLNHSPRKGVDVLIEAFAQLEAMGITVRAVIVGGGQLLERHRALVRARGLDHVVTLTGYVDDPRPHLDAGDVFVLPSRSEQSGSLAVLEAMQLGIPVVASACDGLPEDIDDGTSGLLVPPGDPVALAAALARLIKDGPLRERLATGARSAFEERFSAGAFAADLALAYAEAQTGGFTEEVARRGSAKAMVDV